MFFEVKLGETGRNVVIGLIKLFVAFCRLSFSVSEKVCEPSTRGSAFTTGSFFGMIDFVFFKDTFVQIALTNLRSLGNIDVLAKLYTHFPRLSSQNSRKDV
jgi:hypothetical protein